jgi:CHAT domain-containing protein
MTADSTARYAVSSYIPTLSSLTKARSSWQNIIRTELAGLLICEESTDDGLLRRLPKASQEVRFIRECFTSAGAKVLNSDNHHTSVHQLQAALEETPAHVLHFACHAMQDSDPLKSGLLLQDGKFAIEDIMQLDLPHAVLAYLSACQTAKGDRFAPDQAVHLAASMLFCGFRSVIGTMW